MATMWAVIAEGPDGPITAIFSNAVRPPEALAAAAVLWELQRPKPLPDVPRGLTPAECLQACGYRVRAIEPVAPPAHA